MSRAWLAVAIGVVVVALAGAAGLLLTARHPNVRAQMEPSLTAPPPLAERVPAVVPVAPAPAAPAPAAPAAAAAAPEGLLTELDHALPGLGVPRPARLLAATAQGDRLTLTFSSQFRSQLNDLSALDELTAALSARALTHGYHHLELRVMDARGRAVSLAELVATPAARRPRPEPIDDGVRR